MAKSRTKAIQDVEDRIVPVSEHATRVKVLLYGRNGQGKTRISARAPAPLIIDCNEEGTQSVRNYPGVEVFPAKRWDDFVYAYWYLRDGKHNYETVVVDTLTLAQAMCIKAVLKQQEDRDPNRPPQMPDRRTWGQVGEMMKEQILNYRNLDLHVVFVCQVRKDYNEDEEASDLFVPDLSPASRAIATASVGVMGYVYQGQVTKGKGKKSNKQWVPKMLVGPHENFMTKDRTGLLGRTVINPSINKIIEANNTTEE